MPTLPEALSLAQQALESGDRSAAEDTYRQILQIVPDEPRALDGLGMLFFEAGQLAAAESHVRRAIAAWPRNPAFHNNLNLIYRQLGRHQEAVECCRKAVELDPGSGALRNALGVALQEAGLIEEAAASFRDSIARNAGQAEAHYNLARTLAALDKLEEATSAYRSTIQLAPADFEAQNNLGTLLELQGNFPEAMACYEAALACQPSSPQAHRNRALLRLLLGDFAQGWPEYEWRWRMPDVASPNYSEPRWEGQPLAGRTVLLWAEQGIGDVMQFVRYAPLVKQAAGRVLLGAPASLHALLKSTPGVDRVVEGDAGGEPFDYQVPLLGLPVACGTTLDSIPAAIPYLFADPEVVARWRRELSGTSAFKVGIAWQGNPNFKGDKYRSMPLECFAPLANCDNVRLFSLQKGPGSEQLPALAERLRIVDLGPSLDEAAGAFVDTAAVMMNLDLVITSDTSIAHLAGALGVRVWVALQYAPDWRWLVNRDDSPWYPTMRLFRQSRFAQWDDVFARIADELQSLSSRAAVN